MAGEAHPVPFRTRKLSPRAPMVLRSSPWESRTSLTNKGHFLVEGPRALFCKSWGAQTRLRLPIGCEGDKFLASVSASRAGVGCCDRLEAPSDGCRALRALARLASSGAGPRFLPSSQRREPAVTAPYVTHSRIALGASRCVWRRGPSCAYMTSCAETVETPIPAPAGRAGAYS